MDTFGSTLRDISTQLQAIQEQVQHAHQLADQLPAQAHDEQRRLEAILGTAEQFQRCDDEIQALTRSLTPNQPGARRLPFIVDTAEGGAALRDYVDYQRLIHRVRGVVRGAVPHGTTVLVISKGDDDLLRFDGRVGRHFPQADGGVYAGHHPADSDEAIAHLEALRLGGGDFLLLPATALWWLDHYASFTRHLQTRYHAALRIDDTCMLFDLRTPRHAAIGA